MSGFFGIWALNGRSLIIYVSQSFTPNDPRVHTAWILSQHWVHDEHMFDRKLKYNFLDPVHSRRVKDCWENEVHWFELTRHCRVICIHLPYWIPFNYDYYNWKEMLLLRGKMTILGKEKHPGTHRSGNPHAGNCWVIIITYGFRWRDLMVWYSAQSSAGFWESPYTQKITAHDCTTELESVLLRSAE